MEAILGIALVIFLFGLYADGSIFGTTSYKDPNHKSIRKTIIDKKENKGH